jgi:hypothetical protein
MVDQLHNGAVLKPAIRYRRVTATKGLRARTSRPEGNDSPDQPCAAGRARIPGPPLAPIAKGVSLYRGTKGSNPPPSSLQRRVRNSRSQPDQRYLGGVSTVMPPENGIGAIRPMQIRAGNGSSGGFQPFNAALLGILMLARRAVG